MEEHKIIIVSDPGLSPQALVSCVEFTSTLHCYCWFKTDMNLKPTVLASTLREPHIGSTSPSLDNVESMLVGNKEVLW